MWISCLRDPVSIGSAGFGVGFRGGGVVRQGKWRDYSPGRLVVAEGLVERFRWHL